MVIDVYVLVRKPTCYKYTIVGVARLSVICGFYYFTLV